ncbi:uncharacterized protein KNAG_0D00760 [Huiozyma naganishii CBS 8797]|uniref:Schlafen group 3-like DNA/RNA helicase domain-containing protein n=1 Tax=Huiozyma naganishii (strain ATCC MYA-139 / BCRC 22969 / CBS 8797 / KCTC 17520 / NBRC 10181 / NCYC 3082 / Yp74L-3) TaxID=1071383 RepID=J7RJZ4_HUIN7|nr:hypothetical protein KNAG_0D00760 [Kazachstania naganishii CBS 8797]CCK69828.1 hypothetical protein KNAG_0D00760 [Kazachstania naganishii CBS 8797]
MLLSRGGSRLCLRRARVSWDFGGGYPEIDRCGRYIISWSVTPSLLLLFRWQVHRCISTGVRRSTRQMTVSKAENVRNRKRVKRAGAGRDLADVESAAMNSLSHVELSEEQTQLREKVLQFVKENLPQGQTPDTGKPAMFVIQGDAGTGKSVVLNSLFNEIQRLSVSSEEKTPLQGSRNYLVVNHPEMLKLYLRICRHYKYIARQSLERPTSLINTLQKEKRLADVVIVDEGHLLATAKDAFKRFYGENHLEELMSLAKVLIIVYDDKQALRMGCYWDDGTKGDGANLMKYYESVPKNRRHWYNLKQQFRVAAPSDILDWINTLSVDAKIPKFPASARDPATSFELKIWGNCGDMYEALKEKNAQYGQCRMLSTYDFPYRLDGKDYFVECGDSFKLRWDRYQPRAVLPWSERPDSIDEVGSVYTVQGFDLHYAGVILGRSIGYDDKNDCLKLRPELYDDHAGFTKKKNIHNPNQVKHKIIMNSINVLLTRGTKGLYVYAYDDALRERLLQTVSK